MNIKKKMGRIYTVCAKCKYKFHTDSFYRFICPKCGTIYVQVKNNGEDSYTWEIENGGR